ncbi:hypothetical protein C2G38_2196350 [Gigaspora rosea]|uniref:Uncharacterized protein n=1 Tax=Gigaspora rosea TaxID=44941 RepID=A0A397UXS9_9GLOM|nr:hypothetical protein C2G38_2196350 [Gigaspora rosea]
MHWHSPNQEVSNEQVNVDIWDLPEDYSNYDSSEYGEYMERSASSVEHSFMEAELYQMDNMTQDDASQNMSNVSDIEDHENISFATESYEIGLEDYEGASFDEAFQDLYHPRTVEWPNNAYREFMKIINKYQLSNSAGDAFITFFNKFSNLDISPLLPLIKAGKEFLDDTIVPYMCLKNINQLLVLQYEDKKEVRNGVECRIFGEQYHSNWWKREELDLLLGQHLLSLILYSDATTLNHMGKSSGHPMFLSLENISNHQRNKPESKALIGYLPILKAIDSKTKNSNKFRMAQREVFQKCLSTLLEPIVEGPELHFVEHGDIITFIPRISIIMVEADKFTNVYQPFCSRRSYAKCLVSRDDLNNTNLTEIIPRTPDAMKQVINSGEDKDYSIHPKKNAFLEIRNFNIYEAIVPDRMHALDLGLFKYMLDYTKELLYEQCGGQDFISDWAKEFVEIFSKYNATGLQLLKLHAWCYHIVPAVEEYGSINSMTTETYETLHKNYVKIPYCMSNKKDYMKQILKTVKHQKLTEKGAQKKYHKAKRFGKFLWSLSLDELDDFLENNKNNMAPLQIEGFQDLLTGLDEFFEEESATSINDDNRIKLFSSAFLESTDIIRAISSFHGSPMFSNIIVNGSNEEEEIKCNNSQS